MPPPNGPPSGSETGPTIRIALALGAGGARGVALAAILRRLREEGVPIEAIVGCSVGGIVGAMYAAVGMNPDEMIEASGLLTPTALLNYALSRWRMPYVSEAAFRRSGAIPGLLRRLDAASFDRLHHGVRRLGILTFDLLRREEMLVLGGPGYPAALPVAAAVRASAAIPVLFPPLVARVAGRRCLLADPGWFTAVPVERAFAAPIGAERVIAVDLSILVCMRQRRRAYWRHLQEICGDRLVVLRPQVGGSGTLLSRAGDRARLIAAGEEVVSGEALTRLRSWIPPRTPRQAGFP
jgi:NTE family protein